MNVEQQHIDSAALYMLGDSSIKNPVIAVFRARDFEAARRDLAHHADSRPVVEFVAERIRCRMAVLLRS